MKNFLVLSLVFSSLSAFAMGKTDKSAIKEDLEDYKSKGYECEEKWPEGVYVSSVEPNGEIAKDLECTKDDEKITAKIIFKVSGTKGARCRDIHAVEIKRD